MMEQWNNGRILAVRFLTHYSIIPLFQYSIIPFVNSTGAKIYL